MRKKQLIGDLKFKNTMNRKKSRKKKKKKTVFATRCTAGYVFL